MAITQLETVLKPESKYIVKGMLWIECDGERYFGPGPAELLKQINETGSIRQAALQMGMSYKKAWHIISKLHEKTSSPMVIPQTGGSKGGGSVVTDDAKKMIAWHKALREKFLRFLETESVNLEA